MNEQTTSERVRVLIGGNIYAKRALVRRFLEDDGFDVAGEVMNREELLGASANEPVDAIVVDEDLLGGSVAPLRERAPDARIVVFTQQAPGESPTPSGADGYLEKGIGLASLTAMLNGLMSQAPPTLDLRWTEPPPPPPQERRVLAGLGGVAAAIVALALVALVLVNTLPGDVVPPSHPPTGGSLAVRGGWTPTPLEAAFVDVRELANALKAERTVIAGALAEALLRSRTVADDAGYSIAELDARIRSLLTRVADSLDGSLASTLQSVFGRIFPGIEFGSENTELTDTGADTSTGEATVTDSDGTSDDAGTAAGTGADADGGAGSGGANAGGGGNGGAEPFPGQGNHNGWRNKPPAGGWKGANPKSHGNGPPAG